MENGVERRVGYELKRAQHALRLRMDDALRSVGLTTPRYAALALLEADPGLSNAELARRAFVTPQTMNAIVVNLEAAGLLERRPHPAHGRILRGYPTEAGRETLERAHRLVQKVEGRMLAPLDAAAQGALLDALRRCADSLEDATGTAPSAEG
jgi:DNA-binding MarR family transcriptional regulator